MPGPYFSKLRDELGLPDSFEGIATSLDDLFDNLAVHGIAVTFANPTFPPDDNPNPGVEIDPNVGNEEDTGEPDVPPPALPLSTITPGTAEPESGTTRLLTIELEALSEIEIALPALDGVKLVLNPSPFQVSASLDPTTGVLIRATVALAVRFASDLLVPMRATADGGFEVDPSVEHVDIVVAAAAVTVTGDGGLDFDFGTGLVLTRPAMIGKTGVIVESANISFNLDGSGGRPTGAPAGWRGVLLEQASIRIPEVFSGAIQANSLGFGSGGVTGEIARTFPVDLSQTVLGMPGGITSIALNFRENILTGGTISARVLVSFFDAQNPLDIVIAISTDGSLSATLSGSLATLERSAVVRFEVTSLKFGVDKGKPFTSMSGTLQPLVAGLTWPSFEIQDLRIDSSGHVTFAGGWIDLPNQATLDLFGFLLEITRLGFGTNDDGENWIGFNGALKIVDGVPAGASVEGLRILWGGSKGTHITLEGVGVELEIPGVLKIAGKVSLNGEEFKGAVRVELPAISFEVDGQFVAGSVVDANTGKTVKTYAVYLQMQLPVGIPLGATGLAFYGFAGLYAHNREPAKLADEGWYRNPDLTDGWFTRTPKGITDVGDKWRGAEGHVGFGAGIVLGTFADNGFIFNGQLLLALVFPGPVILIDGMANLFKKRSALGGDEPNFHALVVIEPGKSFTAGLDAQYKFGSSGELLDIRGSAQAFFDFTNARNWYLNLGVDSPPASRIRARLFQLFDVNAFFMLNPQRLKVGAGWSYHKRWGFKHLNVTLAASMEGSAIVSWHPVHFTGDLSVAGSAELNAFGIGAGVSVTAKVGAQVFDPFGLEGEFSVGINLPWPLPDIHKSIHLSWTESSTASPPLPVPVREASVEHLKSRNTWPLTRGNSLFGDTKEVGELAFERAGNDPPGPAVDMFPPFADDGSVPSVPADSKLAVTFARPVNDPQQIALTQVEVEPEFIGNPHERKAAYRVGYELNALALQKWAPGAASTDGSPAWVTIREGGGSDDGARLSVAWLPGENDPDANYSEQNKMFVNAVTPFDYTAERSETWQDWFASTHPGFPCPLAVPELSARFTDPTGTHEPNPVVFTEPGFTVNWIYGGLIADNDLLVATVLGPLERGLLAARSSEIPGVDDSQASFTITPPTGVEDVLVRLGSPKEAFRKTDSFATSQVGSLENPVTLSDGTVLTTFQGSRSNSAPQTANAVVSLPDGAAALESGARLRVDLPEPMLYVELEVEVTAIGRVEFEAFAVSVDGFESSHTPLVVGRNTLHFRGHDTSLVSSVVLRRTAALAFSSARLRRVSWRPPALAQVFGQGPPIFFTEPSNGLLRIQMPGLSLIRILRVPNEGITLLELALPADDDDLVRHAQTSLSRLTKEDPLFEAENDYRLVVTTKRIVSGNDALKSNNTFFHNAYFHVAGPPGVGAPDQPPEQPAAAASGDTGLGDLRLYIEQTLPPTIPAEGGKLLLPRAFYRGFDVAVQFNEPHAELLYLTARRTLTTRLYDVDDNPVTQKDGRAFIPVPSWERTRQSTLKDSVALWIGMVNGSECRPDDLPPFDSSTVVRNQSLSARGEDVVLDAETLYQARLVPSLLHETFIEPLAGLIADGAGHRLERWTAEAEGGTTPHWEIDSETISGAPGTTAATVFFVKETSGNTSSLLYTGALGARDNADAPAHWSNFRASALVRWSAGIVGLDVRRASGTDLLRVTLDRATGARRLVELTGGTETTLASDVTTFPDAGTDVLITIECVDDRVQVFQDEDETPVFDVTGSNTSAGTLALRAAGASNARFTELRVDDLRQTPSSAFSFDFVTSKYTNFYHHLHSFSDHAIFGAAATPLSNADLSANLGVSVDVPGSGSGLGAVSDAERRAFDALEAKALGPAALRAPENLEVLLVSAPNNTLALLVRSPEPLLWERTALEVLATSDDTPLGDPGSVKLSGVSFGNVAADESVTILVREGVSLARHRLEWRELSDAASPNPPWTPYFTFGSDEKELDDGIQVRVSALSPSNAPPREPGTAQRFAAADPTAEEVHFDANGAELRLLAPDGSVLHQRRFLGADAYSAFPMHALRKLDGTAVLLVASAGGATPAALRLRWTFTRALGDEPLPFRQSGSETPEEAVLDLVLAPAV